MLTLLMLVCNVTLNIDQSTPCQQVERQRVAFRADAAFAKPTIYEALST